MADESWDDIVASAGDSFNRPPEGEYEFVITDAAAGVGSKEPHYPNVKVSAKIASGPQAGKSIKAYYIVKSTGGAKKFLSDLKALGITTDVLLVERPTMEQIAKAIIGKTFAGKVVHKSSDRWGDSAELDWSMRPPATGAAAVTSFPALSEGEALGYGSGEVVAAADDAAF